MTDGELADRLCANRWGIGSEMHDLICEAARRLREYGARIAELESACAVLGQECRAIRHEFETGGASASYEWRAAMDATDAHPVAAGYVKPPDADGAANPCQ